MERTRVWWRRSEAAERAGAVNVGDAERLASAALGALLIALGLRRRGAAGAALGALGGLAAARAATGHSRVYEATGVSSAPLERGAGVGIDESVTVAAPVSEVYGPWAEPVRLPRYLRFVRSVDEVAPGVTHWVVEVAGQPLEWDAEVIEQRENEVVAWRTLPGSQVGQSGSVHFREVAGRGTEVRLRLRFVPPAAAGFAAARLLRRLEDRDVAEELRRFKSIVEAGEAPTTEGQPSAGPGGRERPPLVATAPVKTRVEPRGPAGEG